MHTRPPRCLLALVSACAGVGCASYAAFLEDQIDVSPTAGKIESVGGPSGTWTMQVAQCESGMREGFFGVTLSSGDGRHFLRVVKNPVGPLTLAVNVPGGDGYLEARCSVVVGSVSRTGTRINGVPVLTGDVRFICEGLRGSATFTCT